MARYKVLFPLYSLFEPGQRSTIFLPHGPTVYIPLFSSREDAELYATRAGLACDIVVLQTAQDAFSFVRSPPVRAGYSLDDSLDVIMDPISPDDPTLTVWPHSTVLLMFGPRP